MGLTAVHSVAASREEGGCSPHGATRCSCLPEISLQQNFLLDFSVLISAESPTGPNETLFVFFDPRSAELPIPQSPTGLVFSGEDFMNKARQLARSCTKGTPLWKFGSKFARKYILGMTLRMRDRSQWLQP